MVALTSGWRQVALCAIAISAWEINRPIAIAIAVICPLAAVVVIWILDSPAWRPAPAAAVEPARPSQAAAVQPARPSPAAPALSHSGHTAIDRRVGQPAHQEVS
jgi:hypothetical protein